MPGQGAREHDPQALEDLHPAVSQAERLAPALGRNRGDERRVGRQLVGRARPGNGQDDHGTSQAGADRERDQHAAGGNGQWSQPGLPPGRRDEAAERDGTDHGAERAGREDQAGGHGGGQPGVQPGGDGRGQSHGHDVEGDQPAEQH